VGRRSTPMPLIELPAVQAPARHRQSPPAWPQPLSGTETDGSILSPAGANGVVGIKPTVGLFQVARASFDSPQSGHGRDVWTVSL
jgi:amidase